MRLSLSIAGQDIPLRTFRFAGGEVQVRIEAPPGTPDAVTVRADLTDSDSLMGLLGEFDTVKR